MTPQPARHVNRPTEDPPSPRLTTSRLLPGAAVARLGQTLPRPSRQGRGGSARVAAGSVRLVESQWTRLVLRHTSTSIAQVSDTSPVETGPAPRNLGGRPRRYTPEQLARAVELRDSGFSWRQISVELGQTNPDGLRLAAAALEQRRNRASKPLPASPGPLDRPRGPCTARQGSRRCYRRFLARDRREGRRPRSTFAWSPEQSHWSR